MRGVTAKDSPVSSLVPQKWSVIQGRLFSVQVAIEGVPSQAIYVSFFSICMGVCLGGIDFLLQSECQRSLCPSILEDKN